PRFHCSRCDTYFDLLGKPKRSPSKGASKNDDHVEQLSLIPDADPNEGESARASRSRELLSEDAAPEERPSITAQWPDSFWGSPLEADMRSVLDAAGLGDPSAEGATDIKYGDLSIRRAGRFRPVIETKTTLLSSDDEPRTPLAAAIAGTDLERENSSFT